MKKVLNYFLLVMMAMFALNLQSCKDDDDDDSSASIIGAWRQISSSAFGQTQTVDLNDPTKAVYEYFDGQYLYAANYEKGDWEVNRCKVNYGDGKITDAEGGYFTYTVNGTTMTESFYGGFVTATFSKATLPAEINDLIKEGKYSEYTSIYEGTEDDYDDYDD